MVSAALQSRQHRSVAVDAHVHFHQKRLVSSTLDCALANFGRLRASASPIAGFLLLAESSGESVFEQLAAASPLGRWKIESVAGESQARIAHAGEHRIAIICGRQIRCSLGLEVIALGSTARYPDNRDAGEMIGRVQADGALAVIPWGFGKWLGRAGARVRELLATQSPHSLFAGDNGGRLQAMGTPKLLRRAADAGYRILPGTDPFPFGADYRRVGSFGFLAAVQPDPGRPWQSLRQWLVSTGNSPEPYGRALGPVRFAINQGRIQLHNRLSFAQARP